MTGIGGLDDVRPVLGPLAERFNDRGHRLFLVGGAVRDLMLAEIEGRAGLPAGAGHDLDLTTDARPDTIRELLADGADALWAQGERFGTIGARLGGYDLEVTTHRAEAYDPESRKPIVSFGDDLGQDLSRRDFTINAMAIEVPGEELHDPYGGRIDLEARVLRTPLSPEISFTDDPLRMLRAARFIARFGLTAGPEPTAAATKLAERLSIVSVERVADELERLLAAAHPRAGLVFLRSTGLLAQVVPALADERAAALAVELAAAGVDDREADDGHDRVAGDDHDRVAGDGSAADDDHDRVLLRRAGLLWPVAAEAADVLGRLRYSNDDRTVTGRVLAAVDAVLTGPGPEAGTIRRVVASVGLARLETVLDLADGVVRHAPGSDPGRAATARRVAAELRATEDLDDLGSPLTGAEIMATLGIEPGPGIGRAQRYLVSHRLDHGPVDPSDARDLLVRWWRQESGD